MFFSLEICFEFKIIVKNEYFVFYRKYDCFFFYKLGIRNCDKKGRFNI